MCEIMMYVCVCVYIFTYAYMWEKLGAGGEYMIFKKKKRKVATQNSFAKRKTRLRNLP